MQPSFAAVPITRISNRKLPASWYLSLLLSLCGLCSTTYAQEVAGRVEQIVVHGPSLEANLSGDSANRAVFVYLPPSYDSNASRRYPVVYLLHGYGLSAERWMGFVRVEAGANTAIAGTGTGEGVREMIVVSPDALTFYDGSMYSSSVTTGDWETFVARDLVSHIDNNYRTLATRESRGLAGHSMGGYGTLRIGMKFPDVFSALYPMSACCMFDAGEPGEAMSTAGTYTTREEVSALRYPNKSTLARAAAWSPNPQNPPFFFDLPVTTGEPRADIQAKWLANSILAMLDQYTHNLRRYSAITFDVGDADGLLGVNERLAAALTQAGVEHTFTVYEGDHNNKVGERIETQVLPFFSSTLQAQ